MTEVLTSYLDDPNLGSAVRLNVYGSDASELLARTNSGVTEDVAGFYSWVGTLPDSDFYPVLWDKNTGLYSMEIIDGPLLNSGLVLGGFLGNPDVTTYIQIKNAYSKSVILPRTSTGVVQLKAGTGCYIYSSGALDSAPAYEFVWDQADGVYVPNIEPPRVSALPPVVVPPNGPGAQVAVAGRAPGMKVVVR